MKEVEMEVQMYDYNEVLRLVAEKMKTEIVIQKIETMKNKAEVMMFGSGKYYLGYVCALDNVIKELTN